MLTIDIEFDGLDEAAARLAALAAKLGPTHRDELHEAMGEAVADEVRQHIATTKESPNTGWWGRVAESVTHSFNESGAVVSVPYRGAALRYYGGTVRKRPEGPHLTVPFDEVPVVDGTRLAAREMGPLAFLPARRPARKGVVGVLVEGETYTRTRGPNKGKEGIRRKPGGSLLYTLMTEVDHDPDPTVLPEKEQLERTASEAAAEYLFTLEDDA